MVDEGSRSQRVGAARCDAEVRLVGSSRLGAVRENYSQRGRKTNSRSSMLACGILRLSVWSTRSSYSRMSRSMDLGPFSTVFVLPMVLSISLSSLKRSSGERVVSTCKVSDLVLWLQVTRNHSLGKHHSRT